MAQDAAPSGSSIEEGGLMPEPVIGHARGLAGKPPPTQSFADIQKLRECSNMVHVWESPDPLPKERCRCRKALFDPAGAASP
jgi:hypothetical protein